MTDKTWKHGGASAVASLLVFLKKMDDTSNTSTNRARVKLNRFFTCISWPYFTMLYSFSPVFDIHSLPWHCLTLLLLCSFLCLFWNPFDRYMVKSYLSVDLFKHVLICSSLNSPHSCLHCPWPWPLGCPPQKNTLFSVQTHQLTRLSPQANNNHPTLIAILCVLASPPGFRKLVAPSRTVKKS